MYLLYLSILEFDQILKYLFKILNFGSSASVSYAFVTEMPFCVSFQTSFSIKVCFLITRFISSLVARSRPNILNSMIQIM